MEKGNPACKLCVAEVIGVKMADGFGQLFLCGTEHVAGDFPIGASGRKHFQYTLHEDMKLLI